MIRFRYSDKFIMFPTVVIHRNIRQFFAKAYLVVQADNILKNQILHIQCSQVWKVFGNLRKHDKIIHRWIEIFTNVFPEIFYDDWGVVTFADIRFKYQRHQSRFYRRIFIQDANLLIRMAFHGPRLDFFKFVYVVFIGGIRYIVSKFAEKLVEFRGYDIPIGSECLENFDIHHILGGESFAYIYNRVIARFPVRLVFHKLRHTNITGWHCKP